jgi:DNA polymerase-3 subunit gamma/tau
MARMLAQNCELTLFDGQQLQLSVPQDHKHLLDNVTQEKLRNVLKEYFGKELQVRISVAQGEVNTPARQIGQEKAERQAQAEAAIHNDQFVRDLMEGFGAQIVPASIRPIQ